MYTNNIVTYLTDHYYLFQLLSCCNVLLFQQGSVVLFNSGIKLQERDSYVTVYLLDNDCLNNMARDRGAIDSYNATD